MLWQTGLSWRWSRLTQIWWYNTQMGSPHNDLVLFFIPLISVFVIATPTGTKCENWVAQQHICWSLQSSLLILICFELCFFWRNINLKKTHCLKNVIFCGMDKYSIHISQRSACFQSHGFICLFSMGHYFLAFFMLRRKQERLLAWKCSPVFTTHGHNQSRLTSNTILCLWNYKL